MSIVNSPVFGVAQKHPNQPAIFLSDDEVSYCQLANLVDRDVARLMNSGVKPGQRIIVDGKPLEMIVRFLSIWRIGAIACPLNERLPAGERQRQIAFLKAKTVESPALNLSTLSHSDSSSAPTWNLTLAATIIFTSGSTGTPSAAQHSLGNHWFNALGSNKNISIKPGDKWLLSLPLFHVGGLAILFRCFAAGGTVVIPGPAKDLGTTIEKHQITHLSMVTTQLQRLLRGDSNLESLKAVLLGGSAFAPQLLKQAVLDGLPIHTSYGCTEMASQIATTEKGKPLSPAGVLQHRNISIASDKEILVSGKTLFMGYITETGLQKPFDSDGWYATGDLGSLDNNQLTVIGRKDNMFISGGENIQPEEIEKAICRIEGIHQAVVVPVLDNEFGFRPVAFWKGKGNAQQIETMLRTELAGYKIPKTYFSWPASDLQNDDNTENTNASETFSAGIKIKRSAFKHLAEKLLANKVD